MIALHEVPSFCLTNRKQKQKQQEYYDFVKTGNKP